MAYGDGAYGAGVYGSDAAITVAGGLVVESSAVLAGVATVGAAIAGGVVAEATTPLPGLVVDGTLRVGGLIGESSSVQPGSTTVGSYVGAGLVSDVATVLAGAMVSGDQFEGGIVSETVSVSPGAVVLGYASTRRDLTSGRYRNGIGYATWEPAVATPPPHVVTGQAFDKALAFSPVTIVGTQPVFDVTEAATPRHRDRIVVGGRDVTYFRGVETRVGSYQLMEPFAYGVATLEFPQIYPEYEQIGAGTLDWLAPGKRVLIQRIDAAGNVVAIDYKGVLTSPSASTNGFTYEVGGEVTGRAALRHRPMPLFRVTEDIGRQLARALKITGVRTQPRLGPTTGITLGRVGGMPLLDYMQALVGQAWTRGGNQWTVMPNGDGAYEVRRKDRDTIQGTVYLSASSAEADLKRDIAEEPNRIFATGVTPAGKRVRFGRYPGLDLTEGGAVPFPGTLTVGDTGDAVLTLTRQLHVHGYLNAETAPGGFDADVVKAVEAVQEDADLPVTGVVNEKTWEAIFDNASQGLSLKLARVMPAAERRAVRQYRYSASGAIVGRNPFYDPTRLVVDREVDFGTGFTQQQQREWSQAELVEGADANWVGTLTIHSGAVVAGDHTPGDPITEVLPARDIRAGMNLSLPQFQGGIVVHVTAATVSGAVVTLQVDTRARDAWNVSQVIERNRESRRDPARSFFNRLGSSRVPKDAIEEWSEVGGLIGTQVLRGGEWNIVEVVAGRAGTVRSIRIETEPAAESAVAVFGKRIRGGALARLIGDPLTNAGTENWSEQATRRRLERDYGLLYSAGTKDEPGGYSPGRKTGPSPTLSGRFEDDASFAYYTEHRLVLYVAIWVDRDTTLPGGRIMWPQLEAGS